MVKILPFIILEEISDLVTNGRFTFDALKNALINRFSESTVKRFERLLMGEELGDQKSSQLLRRLRTLSTGDNAVSETLLKKL